MRILINQNIKKRIQRLIIKIILTKKSKLVKQNQALLKDLNIEIPKEVD